MIRRRLSRALAWRFGALAARLDALNDRLERLDVGLASLEGRVAEQLQPMLRAILDEESQNRRRLFQLRSSPAYLEAYSDPDPLVSITVPTVGRIDALIDRSLPSLLSQSHTNLEVLVVGDATIKTHVARVLVKLGLRDRVQAVVLAYETGIIRPGSTR